MYFPLFGLNKKKLSLPLEKEVLFLIYNILNIKELDNV